MFHIVVSLHPYRDLPFSSTEQCFSILVFLTPEIYVVPQETGSIVKPQRGDMEYPTKDKHSKPKLGKAKKNPQEVISENFQFPTPVPYLTRII